MADSETEEWEVWLSLEVLVVLVSSKRMGEVLRGQRDTSMCTQQGTRGAEGGSPQGTDEAEVGWLRGAERALL